MGTQEGSLAQPTSAGAVDMCWSHPPILLKLSLWSPRNLWEGEVPGQQAAGGASWKKCYPSEVFKDE